MRFTISDNRDHPWIELRLERDGEEYQAYLVTENENEIIAVSKGDSWDAAILKLRADMNLKMIVLHAGFHNFVVKSELTKHDVALEDTTIYGQWRKIKKEWQELKSELIEEIRCSLEQWGVIGPGANSCSKEMH